MIFMVLAESFFVFYNTLMFFLNRLLDPRLKSQVCADISIKSNKYGRTIFLRQAFGECGLPHTAAGSFKKGHIAVRVLFFQRSISEKIFRSYTTDSDVFSQMRRFRLQKSRRDSSTSAAFLLPRADPIRRPLTSSKHPVSAASAWHGVPQRPRSSPKSARKPSAPKSPPSPY